MESTVVFEAKNPGKLPVPGCLAVFMVGIFGLPALMVIATTIKEVKNSPWLIFVYIGSLFPLAVLYVLKRLMTRYAVRVFQDGGVEIVFPFKTVRIRKEELHSLALNVVQGANRSRRSWVVLGSAEGKVLASFSPSAFTPDEVSGFFSAVQSVNPNVKIQV